MYDAIEKVTCLLLQIAVAAFEHHQRFSNVKVKGYETNSKGKGHRSCRFIVLFRSCDHHRHYRFFNTLEFHQIASLLTTLNNNYKGDGARLNVEKTSEGQNLFSWIWTVITRKWSEFDLKTPSKKARKIFWIVTDLFIKNLSMKHFGW